LLAEHGQVQTILANLEQATARINHSEGLIHYLVEDPNPVQKLDSILSSVDEMMLTIDSLLESGLVVVDGLQPLEEELLGITRDARELVIEFKGIREDLSPIIVNVSEFTFELKRAGKDLQKLRQEGKYTLRMGTELMYRLLETWPLSRPERDLDLDYPLP
jgi:phospholipid/cholesterol/gamma-HCH transport system substrate-binding protein